MIAPSQKPRDSANKTNGVVDKFVKKTQCIRHLASVTTQCESERYELFKRVKGPWARVMTYAGEQCVLSS